jgi:hypothetical protein
LKNETMLKVILGIGGGLMLTAAAQIGRFGFDPQGKLQALWIILALLSKPAMGFGVYHFARHRGYSGGAGVGLFICALIFSMFLILLFGIRGGHMPFVFISLDLFDAGFPVAVLLALPRKNFGPRRIKNRKRNDKRAA